MVIPPDEISGGVLQNCQRGVGATRQIRKVQTNLYNRKVWKVPNFGGIWDQIEVGLAFLLDLQPIQYQCWYIQHLTFNIWNWIFEIKYLVLIFDIWLTFLTWPSDHQNILNSKLNFDFNHTISLTSIWYQKPPWHYWCQNFWKHERCMGWRFNSWWEGWWWSCKGGDGSVAHWKSRQVQKFAPALDLISTAPSTDATSKFQQLDPHCCRTFSTQDIHHTMWKLGHSAHQKFTTQDVHYTRHSVLQNL